MGRKKIQRKRMRITLEIWADQDDRLAKLSAETDQSRTTLIRDAIEQYLTKKEYRRDGGR